MTDAKTCYDGSAPQNGSCGPKPLRYGVKYSVQGSGYWLKSLSPTTMDKVTEGNPSPGTCYWSFRPSRGSDTKINQPVKPNDRVNIIHWVVTGTAMKSNTLGSSDKQNACITGCAVQAAEFIIFPSQANAKYIHMGEGVRIESTQIDPRKTPILTFVPLSTVALDGDGSSLPSFYSEDGKIEIESLVNPPECTKDPDCNTWYVCKSGKCVKSSKKSKSSALFIYIGAGVAFLMLILLMRKPHQDNLQKMVDSL